MSYKKSGGLLLPANVQYALSFEAVDFATMLQSDILYNDRKQHAPNCGNRIRMFCRCVPYALSATGASIAAPANISCHPFAALNRASFALLYRLHYFHLFSTDEKALRIVVTPLNTSANRTSRTEMKNYSSHLRYQVCYALTDISFCKSPRLNKSIAHSPSTGQFSAWYWALSRLVAKGKAENISPRHTPRCVSDAMPILSHKASGDVLSTDGATVPAALNFTHFAHVQFLHYFRLLSYSPARQFWVGYSKVE